MAALSGPARPIAEIVELAKRRAPWEPGHAELRTAQAAGELIEVARDGEEQEG
jgi:antitoxin (DNA-binding transcriptional repressor) of toxin-antitoxin stability system